MTRDLSRLLRPDSIAVIGGGAWCRSVITQLVKAEFTGEVWHVHPREGDFRRIEDLPHAPDAAFVGINRDAAIEAIQSLKFCKSGGAVCFASGFSEVADGADRNAALLQAAEDMPILGPNCYGMINAFDGALLWPDQHGCRPVDKGVAILTQSSNIAINLTMQQRGLPIGYVITCGNQAQTSQAQIAENLLEDERVTAIGLHVEGFGDTAEWYALAQAAHRKGVPLVALKTGRSEAAQRSAISHTASLAGSDTGAAALLDHLGIARVDDLSVFLETLKLLHLAGPLSSRTIATISCSGGEASLAADLAEPHGLTFPPLTKAQTTRLDATLGPRVTLSNPLDYHTYIWRDTQAMTDVFSAMLDSDFALTMLILDFPRNDMCDDSDWDSAVTAALTAQESSTNQLAVVATLPELMPEARARALMDGGVLPLAGLDTALAAVAAAQKRACADRHPLPPHETGATITLHETRAKADLAQFGLSVPEGVTGSAAKVIEWAARHTGPFVLKTTAQAHKTERGGVILGLEDGPAVQNATHTMGGTEFRLESMVSDPVAELLIGVIHDPVHGFVLVLGAGGVETELWQDTVSMLIPSDRTRMEQALRKLRVHPKLCGYRGRPAAHIDAILDAIEAVQAYVVAHADTLEEVEINPLLCTPTATVAVDALIRKTQGTA